MKCSYSTNASCKNGYISHTHAPSPHAPRGVRATPARSAKVNEDEPPPDLASTWVCPRHIAGRYRPFSRGGTGCPSNITPPPGRRESEAILSSFPPRPSATSPQRRKEERPLAAEHAWRSGCNRCCVCHRDDRSYPRPAARCRSTRRVRKHRTFRFARRILMTGRLILRRKISPARMFLELLFVCTAMAACFRMVWQKGLEHNCTSDDVVMGSFPATCTTLDLSNRSVSDYQMKELAASFGASPRLHSVDLSGNQLSDDGARELATAIPGSRLKRIVPRPRRFGTLARPSGISFYRVARAGGLS